MKTSKRNKLLGLALAGSFGLLGASNAFAAANDNIANRATLSYDVGTTPQTVIESGSGPAGNSTAGVGAGNDTVFKEDRVINFTVTREGASVLVAPQATQQAVPYLIANTGNGTHGFLLAGVHNLGALDPHGSGNPDVFTPTTIQTYVDSNGNGVLDPAEIAAGNSFIPTFTPGVGSATGGSSTGAEIRVFVVSDIPQDSRVPAQLVTGDVAVVSLVAHAANDGTDGSAGTAIVIDDNSHFSPGGTFTNGTAVVPSAIASAVTNPDLPANMETVFNETTTVDVVTGATIDATGAVDVSQNAQQSAYSGYTIQAAALTVAKTSAALWDFVNLNVSPKSIPGGSVIRYTVTVTNAAGADASLTTIVDDLPLSIATQFGDGTAVNGPVSGANNVRITDGLGAVAFCTADPGDTAPADGCDSALLAVADRLSVDLAAVAGITNVLQAGQTLTVEFDVDLP